MCTNFEFLKFKKEFLSFSNACIEAEKSIVVSPANSNFKQACFRACS